MSHGGNVIQGFILKFGQKVGLRQWSLTGGPQAESGPPKLSNPAQNWIPQ